jgi:fluoroacetyl-CoA thioesterase
MVNPFRPGDTRTFERVVSDADLARFDAGLVHPVYGTFALARDAEWVCRLFVLEMKEAHEEGIGASVSVEHLAPAPLGSTVVFTAHLLAVVGNRVDCRWEAHRGETLIAHGEQVQRILPRERIERLFEGI